MARLQLLQPAIGRLDLRTAKPAPKQAAPFYHSPDWRHLVAQLIQQRGRRCEATACGRTDTRIFGDHIEELQDGGAALDPNNIQLLCGSCHSAKTAQARTQRMRARNTR